MNKELIHILKGCFLILILFCSWYFILYAFNIKASNNQKEIVIDSYDEKKPSIKNPDGKNLFSANCASCHSINKVVVGPALASITDRIKDKKLLYEWIRNSPKVLKSGNKYFNDLYKEYNSIQMTSFSTLTDADVNAIITYISVSDVKYYAPVAVN